jgi:hypothetical protein
MWPTAFITWGSGTSGRYAVVNLGATYSIHRARIVCADQQSAGWPVFQHGSAWADGFTDTGAFIALPLPALAASFPCAFYAPGPPRLVWGGIRVRF